MDITPAELQRELVSVSELIVTQESLLQRHEAKGYPTGPSHELLNSLKKRRMDLLQVAMNILKER